MEQKIRSAALNHKFSEISKLVGSFALVSLLYIDYLAFSLCTMYFFCTFLPSMEGRSGLSGGASKRVLPCHWDSLNGRDGASRDKSCVY